VRYSRRTILAWRILGSRRCPRGLRGPVVVPPLVVASARVACKNQTHAGKIQTDAGNLPINAGILPASAGKLRACECKLRAYARKLRAHVSKLPAFGATLRAIEETRKTMVCSGEPSGGNGETTAGNKRTKRGKGEASGAGFPTGSGIGKTKEESGTMVGEVTERNIRPLAPPGLMARSKGGRPRSTVRHSHRPCSTVDPFTAAANGRIRQNR
jgi:hypothetical protein